MAIEDEGRIDYDYELGNGWNEYQKLVLGELRRLADQGQQASEILQRHAIIFAHLEEQNKRRDEILGSLVLEAKTLRKDHDELADNHDRGRVRMKLTTKVAGVAVAALAWCATTGLSIYAVFFHATPPAGR